MHKTLKLDFVVKKWQDQKISFGILIYDLRRFQNHKNPVGRIDTLRGEMYRGGGGGGVLGSCFAGYVPLACQKPYPIIVYFWSILWPIINPILVTFRQMIFLLSKSQKSATPF